MTGKEAIAILEKGTLFEPTLENKDYPEAFKMAIEALEREPILCKECEHYYFADNRIPEQQCYVCDYWGTDNPEPTGYCNHAVRKERNKD